jgi:hypothetical protein
MCVSLAINRFEYSLVVNLVRLLFKALTNIYSYVLGPVFGLMDLHPLSTSFLCVSIHLDAPPAASLMMDVHAI